MHWKTTCCPPLLGGNLHDQPSAAHAQRRSACRGHWWRARALTLRGRADTVPPASRPHRAHAHVRRSARPYAPGTLVPGADPDAAALSGRTRAASSCSPTTWRSAPARFTRRRRCARSGRSPGTPPMCSPRAGPKDGRYGENPNRLQHYYQFQVILKPSPPDLQDLYLNSLDAIGIDPAVHDIRFVEDDWESPTLGAWGLGWECWCDGMEVSQFTYFQQVAGLRMRAGLGRADLRARAPRHVCAGRRQRLRPQLQRPRGRAQGHLRRRLPAGRAGIFAAQFRACRHRHAVRAVQDGRGRLPEISRCRLGRRTATRAAI